MSTDDLAHKRELLAMLKRRKQARELQLAQFGLSADPIISIEIANLEQQIEALEQEVAVLAIGQPTPARDAPIQPKSKYWRWGFIYVGSLFIIALATVLALIELAPPIVSTLSRQPLTATAPGTNQAEQFETAVSGFQSEAPAPLLDSNISVQQSIAGDLRPTKVSMPATPRPDKAPASAVVTTKPTITAETSRAPIPTSAEPSVAPSLPPSEPPTELPSNTSEVLAQVEPAKTVTSAVEVDRSGQICVFVEKVILETLSAQLRYRALVLFGSVPAMSTSEINRQKEINQLVDNLTELSTGAACMNVDSIAFEGNSVPIRIQVFTLGLDNNQQPADINPGKGDVIQLTLDLSNCTIIHSDASIAGNCDQRRTPKGDGDEAPEKQPAVIWFHIARKP